ncbi:uncharacterized protein DS421_3g76740 [Arachis hypogaea]|nr:uncharacterized protein DS421_3g76740 [Arachis hypogaea]
MRAEMDGHMEEGSSAAIDRRHYDSSKTIPELNLESENDPLSQGHTDQSSINKPANSITPKPPKSDESTPTVPPAPSKINPALEDTATLMMMAQTASYIPKEGSMPSFSLGLTDSSQEEVATQEGQRAKTPKTPKLTKKLGKLVEKIASSGVKTALDYAEGKSPHIEKQCGEESFEKFETPLKSNEISAEMKEKCYL